MKQLYLSMTIFFIGSLVSFGQDCGCDHYIPVDVVSFDGETVLPGEIICIESGFREQLNLQNIVGSSSEPILIMNCGEPVMINASAQDYGIQIERSDYIRLTGSGSDDAEFGISIDGSFWSGILIIGLTNHFEIDHIEITNIGGPGIYNRVDPVCDLSANEGFFTLENCVLRNLSISDCGAGIMMGHPNFRYGVVDVLCDVIFPYAIENLLISDVEISNIWGRNGIELHGCSGEISNCKLEYIARTGILLGMECDMLVMENWIHETKHYAIKGQGTGDYNIYNNLFTENGGVSLAGVWFDLSYPSEGVTNSLQFIHNTVVGSGSFNLTVDNSDGATHACHIENNIFSESGFGLPSDLEYAPYLNFEESVLFYVSNNSFSENREDEKFAGAADFHLSHDSPAINIGSENEILVDFTGGPRNLAGAHDAGAFEYQPEPIAYFGSIPLVGLYVDDFKSVLGHPVQETALLEFAQTNHFNYLLLYNLSYIHSHFYDLEDPDEAIVLANFIERAKKDYGIVQVGAVGEKNASFDKIETFNGFYGDNWFQKIDVLNLEFEFWTSPGSAVFGYYCESYLEPGGYPCTNAGAYDFYSDQLEDIDERAHSLGIISEIYLGYTSESESIGLAERCDRILLHHYRTSDVYGDGSSIYNYHTYRIRDIALSDRKPAVMPIFSSRSYHMGPWLVDHSLHQPMETWLDGEEGYNEDDSPGVGELPIAGNIWYRYTSFLDIIPSESPEDGGDRYFPAKSKIEIIPIGNTELQIIVPAKEALPNMRCELYSVQGQLLKVYPVNEGTNYLPALGLSSGVYLCVVGSENGFLNTRKIVRP